MDETELGRYDIISLDDIVNLFEDGWDIKESKHMYFKDHKIIKGTCDNSINQMILYIPNIIHNLDYDLTLAHECTHAVFPEYQESIVLIQEKIIVETNPDLIEFTKDVFNLKQYKRLHDYFRD